MAFREWVETVPEDIRRDPLWRMKAYQYALYLTDLVWEDTTALAKDARTVKVAGQLARAVGSIGANIAEGYSRQSARDQARFYEYALGSAREARHWYYQARALLSDQVVEHRMRVLVAIIQLLMRMVPNTRGTHSIAEPLALYQAENLDVDPDTL